MTNHDLPRRRLPILLPIVTSIALSALLGCSDSGDEAKVSTPAFEPDTSYLDDMADDQGIETDEISTPDTDPADLEDPENEYLDEDRDWQEEEGSKSLLGRTRDRGIDIGDRIQNSTEPENGIANTAFDEEYAQAAGFAWDMPADWRMAVPSAGRFAEMYIQHPLGNASVVFSKEISSPAQLKRTLERTMTDDALRTAKARVSTKAVLGHTVTIYDIEGTYIDPGAKGTSNGNPFYAIHAAVIELPTTKVLIKLWGPSQTVEQSKGKFDAMIEKMYER